MACYLFSVRHSHLTSSVSGWQLTLYLSSSQNSLSLVTLPILPAWLLANQCFIKLIRVTNLYSVQEHYPIAGLWTQTFDFPPPLYCYLYQTHHSLRPDAQLPAANSTILKCFCLTQCHQHNGFQGVCICLSVYTCVCLLVCLPACLFCSSGEPHIHDGVF